MSTMLIMVFMCGCGDDGFKEAINNETGDAPPSPGNSGIIAASYILPTSLDIHWQDAGDDLTSPAHLRYRVFVSMSEFTSVQEAERTGVELTGGWTLGISSLRAEIPSGMIYVWCNVFVSDENDNIAAYRGVIPSPYANTPPETDGSSLSVTSSVPLKATVSWTKASDLQTPQTSLRYRVFFSESPSNVNTLAHAEAGGTEVTSGWTYDIGTIGAGLPAGGTWWFNVFVMDGGGLVTGYVQKKVTVVDDRTPPVVNDPVLRLSSRASAVDVSWTKATDPDGETSRDLLQYRLFCSTESSVLDSDLPPSPGAACDVTKGWITFDPSSDESLYFTANGLASGKEYFFKVYVRDLDMKISPYKKAQCMTITAEYPVPGGRGVITAVPQGNSMWIDLSWAAATDNLTASADLLYSVFSSEITPSNNAYGDVSTYDAAIKNGSTTVRLETLSTTASDTTGWVRNIITLRAKMEKATSYYFNVFVKDADGNISAYVPVKQTTN